MYKFKIKYLMGLALVLPTIALVPSLINVNSDTSVQTEEPEQAQSANGIVTSSSATANDNDESIVNDVNGTFTLQAKQLEEWGVTAGSITFTITKESIGGANGEVTISAQDSIEAKDFNIKGIVENGGKKYDVTSIGDYVFYGCTGLTGELIIPNSVSTIDMRAFNGCANLTSLTIGSGVTSIGESAFGYCYGLQGALVIPNSVINIGIEAFYNCKKLTSVTIGSGVTTIEANAFSGCAGLTGELTIPNSVTYIDINAFSSCANLTSLVIGSGVTTIGASAFANCTGLTGELIIPDSVVTIGASAFQNCSGLTSLSIGSGVTSIGSNAFYNCKFTSIQVSEDNLNYCTATNVGEADIVIAKSIDKTFDYAKTASQQIVSGLACGELTIPNSVTSIGNSTFNGCSSLTGELIIPNNVTTIGQSAFYNCTGLTSVTIGSSVTTISQSAFDGCTGLIGELIIPDSVITIGTNAFINCKKLTSLTIESGVTSIGASAFQNCTNLTKITCNSMQPPKISLDTFKGIDPNAILYVPESAIAAYSDKTSVWGEKFTNIQAIPTPTNSNLGMIIGLAVGIPLLLIIAGGISLYFYKKKK